MPCNKTAIYTKENLLNNVLCASPPNLNRDEWVAALPRAMVADLLLFGNKERLKVGTNIEDIYLEHRIERLTECLGSLSGWKRCIKSMIDLLEDCVSQYHVFVANELFKEEQLTNENKRREEGDDVRSKRNMVEVSIVIKIVHKLYKEWQQSKKEVSIGVVSPYPAQVVSIEEKICYKYEKRDGCSVNVKSIDEFQGGEEDIIILSNEIIIDAKKELEPLNDMVKGNSLLLKHVKWKILFSDNFRKSFGKLMDSRMKNVVVDFLQKLSGGWRPNDGNTDLKVLKIYMAEGLYLICSIDIIKEFKYIHVLRIWDILPLKEIPNLRKELDNIFATYTNDHMYRCTTKHLEGLEDIRSMLDTKFLGTRTYGKQEKVDMFEIFQLKQNSRIHAGGTRTSKGFVGFGAEQVILVRDNYVKAEICEYVGKRALVLTIEECKGLEFLDEANWQRLWICEKNEELSKPMFDYWKGMCLVKVRKLNDSIAATCYSYLGDHERAGKFYLEKCGDIDATAECFLLARCYRDAAKAYAKGDQFSNCLSVCRKGEVFDKGFQYIEYWKEHVHVRSKEIEQLEQDFLESCALSYYERKDTIPVAQTLVLSASGIKNSVEANQPFGTLGLLSGLMCEVFKDLITKDLEDEPWS
uniref:DNA2/NAM7 helicase-like C-terminal domain-containing protein n=1 Tax=Lactuca sativa TaxID=4236 RepID=A0A9R1X0E2_LACSA|nr:hypothetical protein LSAT_V11C700353070 [Lactuca sativa]